MFTLPEGFTLFIISPIFTGLFGGVIGAYIFRFFHRRTKHSVPVGESGPTRIVGDDIPAHVANEASVSGAELCKLYSQGKVIGRELTSNEHEESSLYSG